MPFTCPSKPQHESGTHTWMQPLIMLLVTPVLLQLWRATFSLKAACVVLESNSSGGLAACLHEVSRGWNRSKNVKFRWDHVETDALFIMAKDAAKGSSILQKWLPPRPGRVKTWYLYTSAAFPWLQWHVWCTWDQKDSKWGGCII